VKPERILGETNAALSELKGLAKRLPEDLFAALPEDGGWTLGQIFDHLIRSCVDLHFPNAEACLRGQGGPGRKRLSVAVLFWLGGFPKMRMKPTPKAKQALPGGWEPRSFTRTEALEGVAAVARRIGAICAALPNSNPNVKVFYSPMGFLNASEWAQMAPMHIRHHLEVQIANRKYLP
jgi:hypothetical protein